MEYVEHSLSRELLLNPRGLPLNRTKHIIYQLAEALELMHSKQVTHCDIKPANVLLTAQYGVKLCDFGSATSVLLQRDDDGLCLSQSTGAPPARSFAASRWYCAPESLLGGEGTPAGDIWALGCILAELATGKTLLPGSDEELDQLCLVVAALGRLSPAQEQVVQLLTPEQRAKVEAARTRGPLLDNIPKLAACPQLLEAVKACLHPDPAFRATAAQLQGMAFFSDLRKALKGREASAPAPAPGPLALQLTPIELPPPSAVARPAASCAAMDVDCLVAAVGAAISPESSVSLADAASAPQPPVRRSGVQAAAAPRMASRPRVSALTQNIRGRAFDGDGEYRDLMPVILRLVARWEMAKRDQGFGPIALAARRSGSSGLAMGSACSGELLVAPALSPPASASGWAGSGSFARASLSGVPLGSAPADYAAAKVAGPVLPVGPSQASPVQKPCSTPIAAAAGGCGSTAAKAPGLSPMDCSPAPPATVLASGAAPPTAAIPIAMTTDSPPAEETGPHIPISASVGAVPFLAQATRLTQVSAAAVAAAAAAAAKGDGAGASPAPLRTRAIVNRARRAGTPAGGSMPSAGTLLDNSCGRSGLGTSATLLQQELAAAAGPGPAQQRGSGNGMAPSRPGHASRRSFADLSDLQTATLASVAEYTALECETPPDVKRRRGLAADASLSSSLVVGEGSLTEPESLLATGCNTPRVGRVRRNSSGGMGSPVRSKEWSAPGGGAGAGPGACAVSMPQPIAGRQRNVGLPLHRAVGLAVSMASDVMPGSGSSDILLRETVV
ncbi:hypothetical protein HYH03_010806 [Edaphochlamys debaryana]|uniref:Protein kinase domain-containing protein n=1 Tax=Edaphochlamys debaryana TaxID=47281 RepID=A0A835XW41_9CHLO|nr:hypothetical protein HYH03_010806 [Edaphochlamys debaryana]|eukprot:KAG2490889.1 hypothetical protein HYH03_010806 [Edaphochlamys debaryana]